MDNVTIMDVTREGTVIGVVDRQSAPLLVHEGAIYLHGGRAYEVERLDWEGRRAYVAPIEAGYYTQASMSVGVEVKHAEEELVGPVTLRSYGEVRIRSKPTSYKRVRLYTHETLGWGEISAESIPEQEMDTTAYWFSILPEPTSRLKREGVLDKERGDRGPDWERQRGQARQRDGYRCRHCGAPERPERAHDVHHIVPFRTFGYVRGRNDNSIEANALENLVTLCRSCHRRVEVDRMIRGSLSGLAHVLRHIAPLYLMSSSRDVGVLGELRSAFTKQPTVTFYDNAPGGLGLSRSLYDLHETLLRGAREVVESCRCSKGCPSCVGPVDDAAEDAGGNAKANCLRLLELLLEADDAGRPSP
jgi:DEAD/DEAH box helicase domain-containing protein